jgi:hypothetical protein
LTDNTKGILKPASRSANVHIDSLHVRWQTDRNGQQTIRSGHNKHPSYTQETLVVSIDPPVEDRIVARAYAIAATDLDGRGQLYHGGHTDNMVASAVSASSVDNATQIETIEETHRALSDTGATDAIIHPRVAQALGLQPQLLQ